MGDETGKKLGPKAIARRLSAMKVLTWMDTRGEGRPKKRGRGEWGDGTIATMLKNETYAGIWHYGRHSKKHYGGYHPRENWIPIEVPAIINRELFEAAQQQRIRNRDRARRNKKHDYLLTGRMTCGKCGSSIYGKSQHDKRIDKSYYYYTCAAKNKYLVRTKCDMPYFRADYADKIVWDAIRTLLTEPGNLEAGLESHRKEAKKVNSPLREHRETTARLLEDNRTQLERLIDLYISGEFQKDILIDRKKRLTETIAALERELNSIESQIEANELTDEQIESLKDFAAQIAQGFDAAADDFATQDLIMEKLNAQATLFIENGKKVLYLKSMLGEQNLSIDNKNTRG